MTVSSWRSSVAAVLACWLVFMLGSVTNLTAADSTDLTALEQEVYALVNKQRAAIGSEPLGYSEDIARIARHHSLEMATGHRGMGHEGVDDRGRVLARVIAYSQFAENVASNNFPAASTAQTAVTSWLNSHGHKANIEGNFNLTGVGIAYNDNTFFLTQIFLAAPGSTLPSAKPRRTHHRTLDGDVSAEPAQNETAPPRRKTTASFGKEESDPRNRPGRTRVHGGYVQTFGADH